LTKYVVAQREAGFAGNTIGKELRLLKQAYRLHKAIPMPDFPQSRDVLIEPAETERLCAAFTDSAHRAMAEFYFCTGWRGNEIRSLRWENVRDDTIHLVEENSKTGETRDFPLAGKVCEILARREQQRLPFCPWVFHRNGKPISYKPYLRAWRRATIAAGLGPVNPHDCRRAFVTSAVDSGIDPQVARTLSGHKTNAVFERYRIIKTDILKTAIEQREQYVEGRANQRKIIPLRKAR
jgi:integrase